MSFFKDSDRHQDVLVCCNISFNYELWFDTCMAFSKVVFCVFHDDLDHQGRLRTTALIKLRSYWQAMDSDIKQLVIQHSLEELPFLSTWSQQCRLELSSH